MLDRWWRLFGTGLSFTVFGVGGILLSVFVFPLMMVLPGSERARHRRVRRVISFAFRKFLHMMEVLRVLDLDLEDPGVLENERGTVVAANHPTLIDVVLLLAHIESGNCVVKHALWKNPFLGGVVRAAGYIPNIDQGFVLDECERVLRDGDVLVVFPEGTRTRPNQPLKLKRGAAAIAVRAGAPIRLVHIRCHPPTLAKHEPWYRIPVHRPRFSMRVGTRISTREFLSSSAHHSLAARRLTAVLEERLREDVFTCRNTSQSSEVLA